MLLFFSIFDCSYQADKISDNGVPDVRSQSSLSYSFINQNILRTRCLSCHNRRAPLLRNYAEVIANLSDIHKSVLVTRTMPPNSPLRPQEMQILKSWIDKGAPEFSSSSEPLPGLPTPTPPQAGRPVLWSAVKQGVLENKCFNCHYHGNQDGLSDYSDLKTLRSSIGTNMYVVLATKQMPPPPDKLTRDELDIFAHWIDDGMLDDQGQAGPIAQ